MDNFLSSAFRAASAPLSPSDREVRYLAACDLGTVTSRLLIVRMDAAGLKDLKRDIIITHTGEGLQATGLISDAARARLTAALLRFRDDIKACEYQLDAANMRGAGTDKRDAREPRASERDTASDRGANRPAAIPIPLSIVATAALRDAHNSAAVLDELQNQGFAVRVISGEQEAELTFWGMLSGFSHLSGRLLSLDVGGGSTEVALGSQRRDAVSGKISPALPWIKPQIDFVRSFGMGSRWITDLFLKDDPPTPAQLRQANAWANQQFDELAAQLPFVPDEVVAVAGTATTAITVRDGIRDYDSSLVQGQRLVADELDALIALLATLPLNKRRRVTGLHPERAAVIVGGLLILKAALTALNRSSLLVSDTDILQGILLAAAS
ncbi:MAG: hypothetical protein LBU07_04090 [Coriobacteriales bacterium]|jgi:exopolyphosphatase/guanosine-5'-triphosphate,3'-diphosphate pyrophosphatase|nr:hypothetical protein [Coriobacteriales bacterium]